ARTSSARPRRRSTRACRGWLPGRDRSGRARASDSARSKFHADCRRRGRAYVELAEVRVSVNYLPPPGPPGEMPPPGQPTQRRGGCRGCLTGCLITVAVLLVVAVVFVGGVVYVLRQQYPRASSVQDSAV